MHNQPRGRNRQRRVDVEADVTLRSFVAQLAVRLSLIAALVGFAGVTSYSATHWEPHTTGEKATAQSK
jgi:hypothetical protein